MDINRLTEILPNKIEVNDISYELLIHMDQVNDVMRIKYQNHGNLFLFNNKYKIYVSNENHLINTILEDIKKSVYDKTLIEEIIEIPFEQKLRDLIKEFYGKDDAITESLVKCCVKTLDLWNENLDLMVESVRNRNDFK